MAILRISSAFRVMYLRRLCLRDRDDSLMICAFRGATVSSRSGRRLPSTQGVGAESLVVSPKCGRSRVLRDDDHLKEACGTAISAHLH